MNILFDIITAVGIQMLGSTTPAASQSIPQQPEQLAQGRYERALARYTPAEIQRSSILRDVQEAAQAHLRSIEDEQKKLFDSLPPEEQERLLESTRTGGPSMSGSGEQLTERKN